MTLHFLIDECLSPELVQMAIRAGHTDTTCVRDRGLSGTKDWQLIEYVVTGDFTLVTCNSVDFRGRTRNKPGGEHSRQPIHAGLVCLNSVYPLDLQRQRDLFQLALEEIATLSDLVNKALEVFEMQDGTVELVLYDIPAAEKTVPIKP